MHRIDFVPTTAARVLFIAASLLAAACGSDVEDGTGSGGSGSGTGGQTSGETGGGDAGGGDAGGGDVVACECAADEVKVEVCTEEHLGVCEPKTCGDVTVGCIEVKPCETVACTGSGSERYGCTDVGAECETIDCHGNPAQTLLCTEDHIWVSSSSLVFACGDDACEVGLEYCEDVSDAGLNQVQQCKPVPAGCTFEDLCSCEEALAVCPDASCAQTGSSGMIISCR